MAACFDLLAPQHVSSDDDAVRCDGQMSANSAAGTIERLLQ
jgi:hypothetical protein